MATVKEQNIRDAIAAVGNGASHAAACRDFAIHPSTLCRRLYSSTSHQGSKIESQKLLPVQETFPVDWCLNQEAAPSKAEISRMA